MAKLSDTVGDIAQSATEAVQEGAKKAKAGAKRVAKKAEPTAKAAAETVQTTAKKVATAAKKLKTEMFIQWGSSEIDCATIEERVKADYKASNKGAVRSCRIYVKPEEGMVYYVINDVAGKISL